MDADKNIHSGHRQRLKNRFLADGLRSFNEINTLELLLFYAVPRKDTNPIAHRLLDRFGSLSAVLEAEPALLTEVDGVSEHGALLIKLVASLATITSTAPARRPSRSVSPIWTSWGSTSSASSSG